MKLMFHQAVSFNGKDYKKGLHDVGDSVTQSPFFHKMVKAGLITEPDAKQLVTPEPLHKRQERLANKLMGAKKPAPAAPTPLKEANDSEETAKDFMPKTEGEAQEPVADEFDDNEFDSFEDEDMSDHSEESPEDESKPEKKAKKKKKKQKR